jgi:putative flippase GtrA
MFKKLVNSAKKLLQKRFTRFLLVGIANALFDITVLTLLLKIFNIYPQETLKLIIANSTSISISILISFYLNKKFVFKDSGQKITKLNFGSFVVISLIGAYLINNTVLNIVILNMSALHNLAYVTVSLFGLDSIISKNFITIFDGKLISGLCSMLWNFWAYKKFVFKPNPTQKVKSV